MQLRALGRLPGIVRYTIAALAVLAALALTQLAPTLFVRAPFLLFFPVILLVAVVFDHGSSVFATGFAAVLCVLFVLQPSGADSAGWGDFLLIAVFVGTGLALGIIVEAMRHAVTELSAANAALVHATAEAKGQTALLGAFIEGAPDLIYVKDRDGRFVHLNSAAAALLGTTVGEAIGRRDRDFLPAEHAAAIEANDAEVIGKGRTADAEELVRAPDGITRTYLSTKAAWRDADGEVRGLIGVSRDISERKAAEQALQKADAQKQLLLFDINHRIKNHLQTVVGPMSLAAHRIASVEAGRQALTDAAARLMVLGRVYTRLQLDEGESVVEARRFLRELCDDLGASLSAERPVAIHCEVDAATIESSRAVTLGLFVNEVVQNALKYAFPAGRGGAIRVTFRREDDSYLLRIADDGIGIDRACEPGGTGVGRRLIQAMASQLGGALEVSGPPGTAYTLRFAVHG